MIRRNKNVHIADALDIRSSGVWSDPGHFLKSQGKFVLSFPCFLFYIFLTPKNYKLRPWKVFWVAPYTTTIIYAIFK